MPTVVLTDVVLTVNGVNLSTWTKALTLNYEADALDDTNMGDTTKVNIGGLKGWGGSCEFTQDYAAGAPDVTIFSLIGSTASFSGKPTSAATSATNPNFTGTALYTGYQPLKGKVGEVAMTTLAFTSAGALSRSTS
jgi:hypothetical protein